MNNYLNSEEAMYRRARKRVREIRSFYMNLMCYIVVNAGLIFLNLKYTPDEIWFYYPLLGWGVGLAFHAMGAFAYNPFLGKNWEERKMLELMEKEKQANTNQ